MDAYMNMNKWSIWFFGLSGHYFKFSLSLLCVVGRLV